MKINLIPLFLLIISAFPTAEALWGRQKPHSEQARDNAYESAQHAKEAAQQAYEAVKHGAQGMGEQLSDTAGAARETLSSMGGKVYDTVERSGGALHGARESVGDAYEGTKDRVWDTAGAIRDRTAQMAGMAREQTAETAETIRDRAAQMAGAARERGEETAEAIRDRAAQMAGMAREKGDELRGQGGHLYDNAQQRAQYAKQKSESWLRYFWNRFWDIILFIPRLIGNTLAWSWHTSCDVTEDTYEKARDFVGDRSQNYRDQAGQYKERLGDTAENIRDRAQSAAQNAKERVSEYGDTIRDKAGQAKDIIGEKVGQAGDYMYEKTHGGGGGGGPQHYGEQMLDRSREFGERAQQKVGQARSKLFCAFERIVKTILTLATLFIIGWAALLVWRSPERRRKLREQLNIAYEKAFAYMPAAWRQRQPIRRHSKVVPMPHHEDAIQQHNDEVDEVFKEGRGETTARKRENIPRENVPREPRTRT